MILVKPTLDCNLACDYCYQKSIRRKVKAEYRSAVEPDLDAVLATMTRLHAEMPNEKITLHGGEVLMLGHVAVDRLFAAMYDMMGFTTLVTNGTLIDDEYIEMFLKYKTLVVLSIDGPGKYNMGRGVDGDEIMAIARKCRDAGLRVNFGGVLNPYNLQDGAQPLIDWMASCIREGFKVIRLNPVRYTEGKMYTLGCGCHDPVDSNFIDADAILDVIKFQLTMMIVDPDCHLEPAEGLLMTFSTGAPRECTYNGCDPFYTTEAFTILGSGEVTTSLVSQTDSLHLGRGAEYSDVRLRAIRSSGDTAGGCLGCEWWSSCYGGCPGTAVDWRKKTYLCDLYKRMFQFTVDAMRDLGLEVRIPAERQLSAGMVHREIPYLYPIVRLGPNVVNGIRVEADTDRKVIVIDYPVEDET